jgi:hypothetical protein
LRSIWADARRNHRVPPNDAGEQRRTSTPVRPNEPDQALQDAPADRYRTGYPRWVSAGLAAAAGLVLAGAFPPVGFWPLAIAGPALLTAALWRKPPLMTFALGLISGGVFFFALLS